MAYRRRICPRRGALGYPADIRVWSDCYAGYPAERLAAFHDQRVSAAWTDSSIILNELNALTLSRGAFGAGILAGWAWDEAKVRHRHRRRRQFADRAAFPLGPDYGEEIKKAFTAVKDAQIYRKSRLLGALAGGSFTGNAPLAGAAAALNRCGLSFGQNIVESDGT